MSANTPNSMFIVPAPFISPINFEGFYQRTDMAAAMVFCDNLTSNTAWNNYTYATTTTSAGVSTIPVTYHPGTYIGQSNCMLTGLSCMGYGIKVTLRPNLYCVPRLAVLDPNRITNSQCMNGYMDPALTPTGQSQHGFVANNGTVMAYRMSEMSTALPASLQPQAYNQCQMNFSYPNGFNFVCPNQYYRPVSWLETVYTGQLNTVVSNWFGGCPPGVFVTIEGSNGTGAVCEVDIEVVLHYAVVAGTDAQTLLFENDASYDYPRNWFAAKQQPSVSGLANGPQEVQGQIIEMMRRKLLVKSAPAHLIEDHTNMPLSTYFSTGRPEMDSFQQLVDEAEQDTCDASIFPAGCKVARAAIEYVTPQNVARAAQVAARVVQASRGGMGQGPLPIGM